MLKSKTILALSLLLAALSNTAARADCKEAYSNEIKRLDGMLNPARVTLAGTGAAAIAVPITLVSLNLAVGPGAIVAAPVTAVAVGIYYAAIEGRKAALRKTLMLIKNSEKGDGKFLNHFTNHLQSKVDSKFTKEEVATAIKTLNQTNAFCVENENGKVHLFGFLRAKVKVKKALLSQASEESAQLDINELNMSGLNSDDNASI